MAIKHEYEVGRHSIFTSELVPSGISLKIEGQLSVVGIWPTQRLLVDGQDLGSLINDLLFEMSSASNYHDRELADISNTSKQGSISITVLKNR